MINRKDIELLDKIFEILSSLVDFDYADTDEENYTAYVLFKEYIEKQKVAYMKKNEHTRELINEKRKTNPMYARSKTEIEAYNQRHRTDVA